MSAGTASCTAAGSCTALRRHWHTGAQADFHSSNVVFVNTFAITSCLLTAYCNVTSHLRHALGGPGAFRPNTSRHGRRACAMLSPATCGAGHIAAVPKKHVAPECNLLEVMQTHDCMQTLQHLKHLRMGCGDRWNGEQEPAFGAVTCQLYGLIMHAQPQTLDRSLRLRCMQPRLYVPPS